MKRILIAFFAIVAPWIIMLLNDNPGGAFVALVMQATLIGWPFATIWAWRTEYSPKAKQKK
ncbi:hypothetical protein [Legionella sp.]|uniref:hypothetical protein n=1 Tax=Legionella sp. TaxID=459 RepID=UPI003CA2BF66